jgi:hypothetical protein
VTQQEIYNKIKEKRQEYNELLDIYYSVAKPCVNKNCYCLDRDYLLHCAKDIEVDACRHYKKD